MPVAWMWPIGCTQIHTSRQAGGIASVAMRARTSSSSTRRPSSSRYSKTLPRRRRWMPGEEGSTRLRRGTDGVYPGPWPGGSALGLGLRLLGAGAVRGRLRRALLRLAGLGVLALDRGEARLQGGHEVGHLLGLLGGLHGDLLAGGLALDELHDPFAIRVPVLRR